jgi:hypothetical protein
MERIKTIRGQKRLNGPHPRTRTGGQAAPKDAADVSAIGGGQYLNYYLSAAAFTVAKEWTEGCDVEWEVGDPGQPVVAHLTPAAARGFTLRQPRSGQRPHFVLPTGDIGVPAADDGLNTVEEVITAEGISVKLPFAFRCADAEEAAAAEATENVEA